MASQQPIATVIGDVVGSRAADDRAGLHARLREVLDQVNDELDPAVPLRITVGDEYQGCFDQVGHALVAALRLRLLVLPDFDLRHGIGWGAIAVLSEEPRVEDGPGWWAARAAIESVAHDQTRAAQRHLRTAYRRADDVADGPDPSAVNAALLCRDALVGAASGRSLGVLRGLLRGMTQQEIARVEGISASAVSQRVRRDGLAAVVAADELLGAVR
jgi:hypothetical protein